MAKSYLIEAAKKKIEENESWRQWRKAGEKREKQII